MKQIGEFANENQVTVKALHHYEKLGLISPAKVDEFSGYRYYDEAQSTQLKVITYLKSLGFSLSEIKEIILSQMNSDIIKQHLHAKKQQSLIDVNATNVRYKMIIALLDILEKQGDNFDLKEIIGMNEKDIKVNMTRHEWFHYEARRMYESAVENDTPFCVLSADVDRFKEVNDTYGDDVGDIVLERIMNVMTNSMTTIDEKNNKKQARFVREAGDEYKIIVNETVDASKKIAEYIINGVRTIDFEDIADGLSVSVTIGIVSIEQCKKSCSYLFHLSDSALYEAKSKGRDTYLIYSE